MPASPELRAFVRESPIHSTLAQMLRHGGISMRSVAGSAKPFIRAVAPTLQAASTPLAGARRLDALDQRRALPIGWTCLATRSR